MDVSLLIVLVLTVAFAPPAMLLVGVVRWWLNARAGRSVVAASACTVLGALGTIAMVLLVVKTLSTPWPFG